MSPPTSYRPVVIVTGIALLAVFGYALYAALPFLRGPSLSVVPPGSVVEGVAHIEGATERVAFLSINGETIALAEDGSFSVYRAYPPGYTALTIAAKDRFGRERVRQVSFITHNVTATSTTYGDEKED